MKTCISDFCWFDEIDENGQNPPTPKVTKCETSWLLKKESNEKVRSCLFAMRVIICKSFILNAVICNSAIQAKKRHSSVLINDVLAL